MNSDLKNQGWKLSEVKSPPYLSSQGLQHHMMIKKLVSAFSVNKEGLLTKYEVVFEGKLKFIEKNQ